MKSDKKRSFPSWLQYLIAIIVLALGLAYLLVIFVKFTVCNDQIADNGKVGRVCRHVELTDVLVAPVGVLMLVALSTFFAEVSGFGITLKKKLERIEAEASGARREARDALLAAKYNSIRDRFKAGTKERDQGMQRVWSEMKEQLRKERDFDIDEHLGSWDDGLRLAGYAFLLSHPGDDWVQKDWVQKLVKIIDEDSADFNQEKGLETLRTLLTGNCNLLTRELREDLDGMAQEWQQKHEEKKKRGESSGESKRAKEVQRIFEQCPRLSDMPCARRTEHFIPGNHRAGVSLRSDIIT